MSNPDTTTIPKISFTYTRGGSITNVSFQDFLKGPDNHSELRDNLYSYIFTNNSTEVKNYGIVYLKSSNVDNNVFISSNPWYDATDTSKLGTLSGDKNIIKLKPGSGASYILILIKENSDKIKIQYTT